MSLYVTTFPSLWEENRSAPRLIDAPAIANIFACDYVKTGGSDLSNTLVFVEEKLNGVNQVSLLPVPDDLSYFEGEWVRVDDGTFMGDCCDIGSIARYYGSEVVFTCFYDTPNYWPESSFPSMDDEGSLVPLVLNRARPFEDG